MLNGPKSEISTASKPSIADSTNGPAGDEDGKAVYAAPHFIIPPGAQWLPVSSIPPFRKVGWRKGKWFDEEESYTKKLIEVFTNGYLSIPGGTTLRCFLAERLSCDPMRITKKFAGSSCIGKQVYVPCDTKTDPALIKQSQEELRELEEKFKAKVEAQQALDYYPLPQTGFPAVPSHLPQPFPPEVYPPEYYASYASAMSQGKVQATPGLPYYHHPHTIISPHPHPALALPGIAAVNGLPLFGALPPMPPGATLLPPTVGDSFRFLPHPHPLGGGPPVHVPPSSLSATIPPSNVQPISHPAATLPFNPVVSASKMHTVRSVDAISEMKGARGSSKSADKVSSTNSLQEITPRALQRSRARSAEAPVTSVDTDLNASELLLNFFKAAGGSTSSEGDTGSNEGVNSSHSSFSSSSEGAENELESKSNGTTDDEQRSSKGRKEQKGKRGLNEGVNLESNLLTVSKKLKVES